MKHIEVEQRFQLTNHEDLRERLITKGAKLIGTEHQTDVYYNAPHRDFLDTDDVSEWLRLRHESKRAAITYKHWLPEGAKIKTYCDEFESTVSDIEAMRKLLEALDFTQLVTVDKSREEWQLGDIVIALDTVKDLGTFAEFEYKGESAQTVEEAHHCINACLKELGMQPGRVHLGYPHMLIAKKRAAQKTTNKTGKTKKAK
jgi:adenylate cyclase class 2